MITLVFSKFLVCLYLCNRVYFTSSWSLFLGESHQQLTVTFDGKVIETFDRKDPSSVVKAHCLQMGLIWIYNVDYKNTSAGKSSPEVCDFFEFCMVYLWNLRTKEISSGTGQRGRSKPATKKGVALAKEIFVEKKNN